MVIYKTFLRVLFTLMLALVVKGMFFTDSKENDYPRIGKRCQTSASSSFYKNVLCQNNNRGKAYKKANAPISYSDLLTKLSDIYGTANQEDDRADSSENIFSPIDVKAYDSAANTRLLTRVRQYLRNIDTDQSE